MRQLLPLLIIALSTFALPVLAADLSPDDQAFIDKHTSDLFQFVTTKIDDPAVLKVFEVPFFHITLHIKTPDGDQTQDLIAFRQGDKLAATSTGFSDSDLPDLVKMLKPDLKLKTDDDGKALEHALETVYPIMQDSDKKIATCTHAGNQWTVVRGVFFDKKMGYVFQTDDSGTITSAKFVMKLP